MAGSGNMLQCFWDLSSVDEEERVTAGVQLVTKLEESKKAGTGFEEELLYCVERLVAGLASHRKGARQGYFTVFCELLIKYRDEVSLDQVFKLVHDKLECIGNVKASEERGSYFGRVFALLGIVHSQLLIDHPEFLTVTVEKLMTIFNKKVNLREFCVITLTKLFENLQSEVVSENILPCLSLESGWSNCSPDKLLILLSLQSLFGKESWYKEFIQSHWDSTDVLSCDNFDKLAPILLLTSQTHPRIHSVWPHLFNQMRQLDNWPLFWSKVIDGGLLISTRERKFLVYQLIEKLILPSMNIDEVGVVLSQPLFRQIYTSTQVIQHPLYEASTHLLDAIVQCVSNSSILCVGVWLQLIKTKHQLKELTSKILSKITVEGVVKYTEHLLIKGTSSRGTINDVALLMKCLPHYLRDRNWIQSLGCFVLTQAHCHKKACPVLSQEDKELYNQKLITIINDLASMKPGKDAIRSCDTWSVAMVTYIKDLLASKDMVLDNKLKGEEKEVWSNAVEVINEIIDKRERKDADIAFLNLLSLSTLEIIYSRSKGISTTQELITCYENMSREVTKTPKRNKTKWMEVLIDVMLGLLSHPHNAWRTVIDRSFHLLIPYMTDKSFQLILKVIESRDVEELMEVDDSEDEEGDEKLCDPTAEFVADVRNALGDVAAVDSDQESIMSIDENEMEVLDQALSEAFRKRNLINESKKQKKTDEISMMHFKMRVLDLIEIYIRCAGSDPLILEFIRPLFELTIRFYEHKTFSPLSHKCAQVLEKLCKIRKYPHDNIDIELLHSLLEKIITINLYKANKHTVPYIITVTMFLVKLLKAAQLPPPVSPIATRSSRKRKSTAVNEIVNNFGGLNVDRLTQLCSDALTHMITVKNSNVPIGFFQNYAHRYPDLAEKLVPSLSEALTRPGNHFKSVQGDTLLKLISK